jgi:hypothetical protein
MIDISPQISIIFFSIWLVFFLAGRYQFESIKKMTADLVEKNISDSLKSNPNLSVDDYYQIISKIWLSNISKNYYFIPHKTELFPVKIFPESLMKRINFSPEWVGAYLKIKGFRLVCSTDQAKRIDDIVAKAPKNKSKI